MLIERHGTGLIHTTPTPLQVSEMHAWLDLCCGAFNSHWVTYNLVQYGIHYTGKQVDHLVTINVLIMKVNNEQRAIGLGQGQAGHKLVDVGRKLVDVAAKFNVVAKPIRNLRNLICSDQSCKGQTM